MIIFAVFKLLSEWGFGIQDGKEEAAESVKLFSFLISEQTFSNNSQ